MFKAIKVSSSKKLVSKLIIDSNVIIDTFDPKSDNYDSSIEFLRRIDADEIPFAMPMHGWFEIKCNINKISKDRGIIHPVFNGKSHLKIEFIHIDDVFVNNYQNVEVPFIKAKDHLFLIVAIKHRIQLVTWDGQMTRIGKESGIIVSNPVEWMALNSKRS